MTAFPNLKNSLFYKLSSKSKLAKLLGCKTKFLHTFRNSRENYKIYETTKKNDPTKKRPVEEPKEKLKTLHKKIKKILDRLQYPDYLQSGVKGKSYIDNAKKHCSSSSYHTVTMDLAGFYQHGRKSFLASILKKDFLILDDIAWLLADIMTVPSENGKESYFPTGSPISQLVIYLTYKKTFDDIAELAKEKGIIFTLYVDDMTFSSPHKISNSFIKTIKQRLENVQLEINTKKTRHYKPWMSKIITGCIVKNNKILVRNTKRKEIIDTLSSNLTDDEKVRLIGKISAQQQIQPNIFNCTKKKLQQELLAKNP